MEEKDIKTLITTRGELKYYRDRVCTSIATARAYSRLVFGSPIMADVGQCSIVRCIQSVRPMVRLTTIKICPD